MSAIIPQNSDAHDYSWVYSDLKTIQSELEKRKNDAKLAKRLDDFWAENRPHFIDCSSQYAFFSRPVATPNIETMCFVDNAKNFLLTPLIVEYPDKFVSKNNEKRFLGKLAILNASDNPLKSPHYTYKRIVDFNAWDGKQIADVRTIDSQSLIEFHHNLFNARFPELRHSVIDFSDWFKLVRSKYHLYYLGYLSLFIRNGVLFENFLFGNSDENTFVQDKVLPSIIEIEHLFGVKPLIYPILPIQEERDVRWLAYKNSVVNGDTL